jgi:hypothetical protein
MASVIKINAWTTRHLWTPAAPDDPSVGDHRER